jgi:hypothetical protein
MRSKGVLTIGSVVILAAVFAGGCDTLRFAPGEKQKQNAYLHHRTVQTAAVTARQEQTSEPLRTLTTQAEKQSEAIMAYYGLPRVIPQTENVEQILSEENKVLTSQSRTEAISRPDPWDVADHLLEMGIAIAGFAGGVAGGRVIGGLKTAQQKSRALREIVHGNELFKKNNPIMTDDFKQAQQNQSDSTRRFVAELKTM